MVECRPNILVYADGLVGAPDQTAGEEHEQKQDSIVELCLRSSHIQFVKEPVQVQEGSRELVQDESAAVEVDKRSLQARLLAEHL